MGEPVRKVRSDKKIDVRPTVDLALHDCISRISYITMTPMKDVLELVCINGLQSEKVIEILSKKFRRNYQYETTLYFGDISLLLERTKKRKNQKTQRLTVRFLSNTYAQICDLAFALDVTVSTATAQLIELSVKNTEILNDYISRYVYEQLDQQRKSQLKIVWKYVQEQNPYGHESMLTFARFISFIMGGVIDQTRNVKKVVEDWLDQAIEKQ